MLDEFFHIIGLKEKCQNTNLIEAIARITKYNLRDINIQHHLAYPLGNQRQQMQKHMHIYWVEDVPLTTCTFYEDMIYEQMQTGPGT